MQTYLKTKPVISQLFLFIGLAFGLFMMAGFIGGAVLTKAYGISSSQLENSASWKMDDYNLLNFFRWVLLIQFLFLFLIPSLLFAYFSDPSPVRYLGLRPPRKNVYWLLAIAIMLVSFFAVEYIGALNKNIKLGNDVQKWMTSLEEDASRQTKFMIDRHTPAQLLMNILFVGVFAGVGEELCFRGILQRMLIRAFKNPWIGIIAGAMLFSISHFQFFGFFPRLILGTLLGALYWFSGSIWISIAAHVIYNSTLVLLIYFRPQLLDGTDIPGSGSIPIALASAALTVVLVWIIQKKSSTSFIDIYKNDRPQPDQFSF